MLLEIIHFNRFIRSCNHCSDQSQVDFEHAPSTSFGFDSKIVREKKVEVLFFFKENYLIVILYRQIFERHRRSVPVNEATSSLCHDLITPSLC